MIITLLNIFLWIIFLYCAASVAYLLLFSLAGFLLPVGKRFTLPHLIRAKKIAILVPAYKEDGIIISTARNLLQLQYPSAFYEIFIIADSFHAETLTALRKLPVQVLEVQFDKSTKTRALNDAFSRIREKFDIALVCDADNMLARDFLQHINAAFQQGAKAVQGQRVAKNLDTSFAILDACSEGINNHIFRKGANALGLSSSIIGSGMAFEYEALKQAMAGISAVGGFDKVLQLKMVEQGHTIHYLERALIFDEKVATSQAFEHQRRRWVSSQFIYLKQFFFPAFKNLLRGQLSYFNLALMNNLVLPRAFLLALLPLLAVSGFFLNTTIFLASLVTIMAYGFALLLGVPAHLVGRDLFLAFSRIPKAITVMLASLLHIRQSNKRFIHTVHTKTTITNPLFEQHAKQLL